VELVELPVLRWGDWCEWSGQPLFLPFFSAAPLLLFLLDGMPGDPGGGICGDDLERASELEAPAATLAPLPISLLLYVLFMWDRIRLLWAALLLLPPSLSIVLKSLPDVKEEESSSKKRSRDTGWLFRRRLGFDDEDVVGLGCVFFFPFAL
jgi:hypothetical protein